MTIKSEALAIVLGLAMFGVAGATPDRGLWMWGSTTLPGGGASTHGTTTVVGDSAEEDLAIAFMVDYGITRVFGSYGTRPQADPERTKIATWNAKLDAAGIDSQLLLEGTAVNDPAHLASLAGKIASRLISFNNSRTDDAEKFDALHLDIEPQQLDLWKDDVVGTDKRGLLTDLADAYEAIWLQLDGAGVDFTGFPIYADINFSWDKLPVDGGSVAWGGAGASEAAALADRNAWYLGIGADLTGLTIMTFSKDNALALAVATDFERTGTFPGPVVVGIQPKTGVGEMWANHSEFHDVMVELESDLGTLEATDIENYGFLRHAVATEIPTIGAGPQIIHSGLGGGVIIWGEAVAGQKYEILENPDPTRPGDWTVVKTYENTAADRKERFEHATSVTGPQNFWRFKITPLP